MFLLQMYSPEFYTDQQSVGFDLKACLVKFEEHEYIFRAFDKDWVIPVFDLFSCCDDDNYVVTRALSVTMLSLTMCVLHHELHPASL